MLLLARSVGEKLIIGEDVTVTVLGLKGNQIRIGIDAPRSVRIDREENLSRDSIEIQFEYQRAG